MKVSKDATHKITSTKKINNVINIISFILSDSLIKHLFSLPPKSPFPDPHLN